MPDRRELEYVAFRAPRPLVAKLDLLAEQTGRNRSAVLRLLLREAELAPRPDVTIRSEGNQEPARG